ncbi:prolipoprotein diacylglyceryl transferase [Candidatus Peregrinibacteria bacterium HGW-Peregrinibacteria-1]|jgi:prolipoprotein diacylglyceryl transferase|nr:MAG: prolipoprotein diacylglyceryl transferase [Candidatus Peregrinibacteria bacterium HGW-Peregrinibacteria-1]
MIIINDLSPILTELGPISLRWYGLFFATGLFLSYMLLMNLWKRQKWEVKELDSLVIFLFVGLLVGARLGHIIFYRLGHYLENPWEIFAVWEGGLASHGAAIGLFVAYLLWCRKYKVRFFERVDAIALSIPFTAAFVRIGNYFNSEIVGTPTNGEWGVVFKRLGEDFPRHPAMLYETFINLIIIVVFYLIFRKRHFEVKKGFYLGLFIVMYFGGRFISEFWKDLHGLPESFPLSMGQVLSLTAVLIGLMVLKHGRRLN